MQHRGIETPDCMAGRPVDHRGFPVPWFVTEKDADGHWDFTAVHAERFEEAVRRQVCWVSGQKLGRWRAFVVGPMCTVNRVAGDPPVRLEVARWSVRICPFLSRPLAQRDKRFKVTEEGILDGQRGIGLARNPGVSAIYVTDQFQVSRNHMFFLGRPKDNVVSWWAHGREATPAEVWTAFDRGFPVLSKIAEKEGDEAVIELGRHLARAMPLLPPRPAEDVA